MIIPPNGQAGKAMLHDQQKSLLYIFYIFTVIFCALLFSARSSKAGSSAFIGSSIGAEAQAEAEKFWATQITKCGDSSYRKLELKGGAMNFFEIKEPVVRLNSWKVTEADRLNGIEWHVIAALQGKATRLWGPSLGHWEAWRDGISRMDNHSYPMKKINGEWSVDTKLGGIFDEVMHYVSADCAQLPQ